MRPSIQQKQDINRYTVIPLKATMFEGGMPCTLRFCGFVR